MFSIGIDIIEVARIEATEKKFGQRFLARVFTEGEISFCEKRKDRYESYAARFACKEAILKAIGTGKSSGIRWKDMEIIDDGHHAPVVKLRRRVKKIVGSKKITLSLSHIKEYAVAVALLNK